MKLQRWGILGLRANVLMFQSMDKLDMFFAQNDSLHKLRGWSGWYCFTPWAKFFDISILCVQFWNGGENRRKPHLPASKLTNFITKKQSQRDFYLGYKWHCHPYLYTSGHSDTKTIEGLSLLSCTFRKLLVTSFTSEFWEI